jgi:hypothetical protein
MRTQEFVNDVTLNDMENKVKKHNDAKLLVSSRFVDDAKRICRWYAEWTNSREKIGVELFGIDYELKYAAERVLSELNDR